MVRDHKIRIGYLVFGLNSQTWLQKRYDQQQSNKDFTIKEKRNSHPLESHCEVDR